MQMKLRPWQDLAAMCALGLLLACKAEPGDSSAFDGGPGGGGSGDDGTGGGTGDGTGGGGEDGGTGDDDGGSDSGETGCDPNTGEPPDEVPATCGNGEKDAFEQCDCGGESCAGQAGSLGYKNCLDFCAPNGTAYVDGILECTDECRYDLSGCIYCGDGVIGGIEQCDGDAIGDATCFDADYLGGGTLACNDDCTFDTSGCNGPMCGEHVPAPGAGSCPAACTTCEGPVCVITCSEDDQCEATTIQCPDGWDCRVECSAADDACKQATINCPTDGACEVLCEGMDACEDGHLTCGGGLCDVTCEATQDTCDGLQVTCDRQACSASCDFTDPDEMPQLTCGESCLCTPCA